MAAKTKAKKKPAKEPEWEERVVCNECGHHRPYVSGHMYWLGNSYTARRMRKVNGEWETHPLDDPALEEKIREVSAARNAANENLLAVLEKHMAISHRPRWWQFWRR